MMLDECPFSHLDLTQHDCAGGFEAIHDFGVFRCGLFA